MTISSRGQLVDALENYTTDFAEEAQFVTLFLKLLRTSGCYQRNHLPGHITGSAWIVNSTRSQVLLIHHAKLNKWLQPGGHADGDEDVLAVAAREAYEETGLTNLKTAGGRLFDIDIHPIPAIHDFPEHLHFDIRFLFEAETDKPVRRSDESHAIAWTPLYQVTNLTKGNPSIARMMKKTTRPSVN